jgi:hypothetical protein
LEKTGVAVPIFVICLVIVGAVCVFVGYKMAPAAAQAELTDGSVTTTKLADGAVTPAKLASEVLTRMPFLPLASENLANGAVTTSKLADNVVTLAKLASDVVSRLGAPGYGLVTTDNIADGAVTTSKLADGAVTSGKISDNAIVTADIADNAITSTKIAENAVTWDMVADKPIEVAAAGYIYAGGTIGQNFNVSSVTWNLVYHAYEISLAGISYSAISYITVATAYSGIYPRIVTTGDIGNGNLFIFVQDNAWNRIQSDFHFVVYKIA